MNDKVGNKFMTTKQWPFIEANKLLNRLKKNRKNLAVLESGYGPSGLPHIGTFAEAARTSFVISALNLIAPEISTRFIAFSDDMDGLRALPENIPNHEILKEHLGKPLSSIPDPYGEYDSFSENMNNRLKEFLSSFGFDYEFISSTDMYRNGVFNEGLSLIMKHHKKIIDIFTATISEEKREYWSPFFPICQNCGKITTTRVTGYDIENNKVQYTCTNDTEINVTPCGYKGEVSILDGLAKVGWKIDWALRWYTLGIDYEMYGKDLIDSYTVSEKVIKVIGGTPPVSYKYELFLDESGHKISKKIGNGVSIEEWLRYAPTDALLYFIYGNPNQPKKMSLLSIPKIVDQYMQLSRNYMNELDSPIKIIEHFSSQKALYRHVPDKVEYSLIVNLVRALNVSDPKVILDYLERYDVSISNKEYSYLAMELVQKAINYNNEVLNIHTEEMQIDTALNEYLERFYKELQSIQDSQSATADTIQTLCFNVARENNIDPKRWFQFLYQVLLNSNSGPRLGSFIILYGIEQTINKIRVYLNKSL